MQDVHFQPNAHFDGIQQTYFPCRRGNRVGSLDLLQELQQFESLDFTHIVITMHSVR